MNKKVFILLVLVVLIVGTLLAILPSVTVFEDGSWAVGQFPYPLSGCLPWGLCN